jgi:uroporphyrinogen decarboxylase
MDGGTVKSPGEGRRPERVDGVPARLAPVPRVVCRALPRPEHRVGGPSRRRFFATIRHERPDRVPLDLWARREVIEQLQQYLETTDVNAALGVDFAEVKVADRFPDFDRRTSAPRGGYWPGASGRYLWHDERTFEDAWGVIRRVGEDGKLVQWISGPLVNAQHIDEFPVPSPQMLATPEELAGTVAELKARDKVVSAEVVMPFKRAWHLRGLENLLCDMIANFDFVDALYERLYPFETERAVRAALAGVDIVKVVGDIAMEDRLMFRPELFRRLDVPRLRELIRRVRKARPDVLMFYHSDGDLSAAMDDLIEVGFDIINPIQPECMDPYEVKKRWGNRVTLWGTIGVRTTLPRGTAASIRAVVHERIRRCGHDGGLVLAPANAISYDTPVENVVAMFDAARDFTWQE